MQTPQRGSGVSSKVKSPVRDSISTNLRIKNEKVTSKILMEQFSLQQILSNQFNVKCTKVDLPVYTQLEFLKKDKDFLNNLDASIAPPGSDLASHKPSKKYSSMFSDASIVQYGKQRGSQTATQSNLALDMSASQTNEDLT